MLFLHIFQKSQNQQGGATKVINQLNVAMWEKKITSNLLRNNKILVSSTPKILLKKN